MAHRSGENQLSRKEAIMKTVIVILTLFGLGVTAQAQDWTSSPNNWANLSSNWQNSPNNWRNSPNNWQNSPNRWGNERIIRDQSGRAAGYAVPRPDGGVNYFDLNGNRKAYQPPKSKQAK